MIVKSSRFLLILLVVFIAALILPKYFWISFGERVIPPQVRFSPLSKNFLIGKTIDKTFEWFQTNGESITREEADSLMPFMNYRLLAAKSLMPDSVNGQKIELDDVRSNSIFERIRPYVMDAPEIALYPLFESRPERFKLELPPAFFRITDRMEFITAETNEIDESLSELFTSALEREKFNFPMTAIFGNPTTRKPFDEGYFIVDHQGQMFHLKMIQGKPFCKNIRIPKDVKVKYLSVRESELREFYGLLIDQTNKLYLLMYDNYRLQHLPITNYDSEKHTIVFIGNLQLRTFLVESDNTSNAFVTDRNYSLIAEHKETWAGFDDTKAAFAGTFLFPFEISLTQANSKFISIDISKYQFSAIYMNIMFLILAIILLKYRKTSVIKKWYDLIIVLVTGVFGFIAIAIFENTDAH